MKFTLSWLQDHLATKKTLDEILDLMVQIGLEVESVDDPAARLAPFTVCKVTDAQPHPDADKLRVCTVETVDGTKQIVCGAPNARAGMTAIYAPLGAYIPGLDFALDKKPRKIRGVESYGMMCSAKELEAGEDHDGIADLDDSFPLGTPASVALEANDPVIDFEVTPNRPDWLGVMGIARDLAAAGAGRLISPELKSTGGAYTCPIEIELHSEEACPIFAGVLIKDVKDGPSPAWMQKRLSAVGIQPKSLLVDVTNYVSLDRARPLHAYDADKLQGTVHARLGRKGETLEALDGKTYNITEDMCVIADDSGVIGLGGVTTGIISDARYRFERGVDTDSCMDGLRQAVELITKNAGGEVSKPIVAGIPRVHTDKVTFQISDVKRLTGLDVKSADMKRMLKDLGFGLEDAGDSWYLDPPTWRFDVEQSADLVEEIARLTGFDALPQASLPAPENGLKATPTPLQKRVGTARRVMASRGFLEAVTWSFMSKEHAALFEGTDSALTVANPVASELNQMRPTIYASSRPAPSISATVQKISVRLSLASPSHARNAIGKAACTPMTPKRPRQTFTPCLKHWASQRPASRLQSHVNPTGTPAAPPG